MASLTSVFGKRAENEAERWWRMNRPESRLLARNFRCLAGEVDLIYEERRPRGSWELVFVEVRSRSAGSWVDAASSVTFPKRQRFARAARIFLAGYRGPARTVRLDILARDGGRWTHFPDAWNQ